MAPGEENIVETKLLTFGPPCVHAGVLEATVTVSPEHPRRRRDGATGPAPIRA